MAPCDLRVSGGGAAGASLAGVYVANGCRSGRPLYVRAPPANATSNATDAPLPPRFLVFSAYWGDWDFANSSELSEDVTLGYGGEGDAERRPELVPARDWYVRMSLADDDVVGGGAGATSSSSDELFVNSDDESSSDAVMLSDDTETDWGVGPGGLFREARSLRVQCADACNDGRWNFDEEGVDCGGASCAPCADVYGSAAVGAGAGDGASRAAADAAHAEAVAQAAAAKEKAAAAEEEARKAEEEAAAAAERGEKAAADAARARAAAAADAAAASQRAAAKLDAAVTARNAELSADLSALKSKLAAEQRAKDDVAREEAVARVALVGVLLVGACIVLGGPLLFYLKKGGTGGGIGGLGGAAGFGSSDKPPRGKRRTVGV
jgi:hypothetical protein